MCLTYDLDHQGHIYWIFISLPLTVWFIKQHLLRYQHILQVWHCLLRSKKKATCFKINYSARINERLASIHLTGRLVTLPINRWHVIALYLILNSLVTDLNFMTRFLDFLIIALLVCMLVLNNHCEIVIEGLIWWLVYSCDIPAYHPKDVIRNVMNLYEVSCYVYSLHSCTSWDF